ncbi:MAG: universal stress protein, partial [Pseudomonadota bacterium]
SDVPITHEVCEAPTGVQHTITNYIANNQIDLIVMSSHGRSGIARALLGSVTEYVLRHCKKPVLVVPA